MASHCKANIFQVMRHYFHGLFKTYIRKITSIVSLSFILDTQGIRRPLACITLSLGFCLTSPSRATNQTHSTYPGFVGPYLFPFVFTNGCDFLLLSLPENSLPAPARPGHCDLSLPRVTFFFFFDLPTLICLKFSTQTAKG